jgi:hypothetical protein
MKSLLFLLLLLVCQRAYSDLTKAYGFYLSGNYDSAYTCYLDVYEQNKDNLDAVYGMINCHIAKKEYDTALNLANDIIKRHQNSILYSKLIYLLALKNDKHTIKQVYEIALKMNPDSLFSDSPPQSTDNDLASVIYSAGCGFFDAHRYRDALEWFSKGDSMFSDMALFKQARFNSQSALHNQIMYSSSVNGGALVYSPHATYKRGSFFSGNVSVLFDQTYSLKTSYTRTDIQFKPLYYGLHYDTLYASKDGNPLRSGHTILSSRVFTNLDGESDTMYFTCTQHLTSATSSSFDTVVMVVPEKYYQNDFYVSLTDYGSMIHKTALSSGFRLSTTNMLYTSRMNTFFFKHASTLSSVNIGAVYYVSILDNETFFQFSPQIEFNQEIFFTGLTVNTIFPSVRYNTTRLIDSTQLSTDLWVGMKLKTLKFSVTGMYGDKKFCNGADGELLHNVLYPYKYGIKSLVEWTPQNKWLTLYHLLDYSKYRNTQGFTDSSHSFSKYVIMGGVYIQW